MAGALQEGWHRNEYAGGAFPCEQRRKNVAVAAALPKVAAPGICSAGSSFCAGAFEWLSPLQCPLAAVLAAPADLRRATVLVFPRNPLVPPTRSLLLFVFPSF